jgi:hypothetical protein
MPKYCKQFHCSIGQSIFAGSALMRIAYVGLSGPVAYDYGNSADKGPADGSSSPNPILFGAIGVMLLLTKLWFVSRSMCPQSMRTLGFVRFLDEDGGLVGDKLAAVIEGLSEERTMFPHSLDESFGAREDYAKVRSKFLNFHDFKWDNHTHGLKILGQTLYGNSGSRFTLELDRRIRNLLNAAPVEQVYNPCWTQDLTSEIRTIEQTGIVQELVLRQIPNAFDERGPKVDDIQRWRDHNSLGDFRQWIAANDFPKDVGKLTELAERIEQDIFRKMKDAYKRELNKYRAHQSLARNFIGEIAGALLPGSGLALATVQDLVTDAESKRERWRVFLLDLIEEEKPEKTY